MSRWVGFFIFAVFGLALLWSGLQMPVHLRAVDGIVLRNAGKDTPSLVDGGLALVTSNQLGAAQLFLAAVRSAWITNSPLLSEAVDNLAVRQPDMKSPGRFGDLIQSNPRIAVANTRQPIPQATRRSSLSSGERRRCSSQEAPRQRSPADRRAGR